MARIALVLGCLVLFSIKEILSRLVTDHPGGREVIHALLTLAVGSVVLVILFNSSELRATPKGE